MKKNRWEPYVKIGDNEATEFLSDFFNQTDKKLLFIIGKGFDVRMNLIINKLLKSSKNVNIECLLVEYKYAATSASRDYSNLVEENLRELTDILDENHIKTVSIELFKGSGGHKKWSGDRDIINILPNKLDDFTDIILDISALSRNVYPTLIGAILNKIDNSLNNINFFVGVSENAQIDALITEVGTENDLKYLHGFMGQSDLFAEEDKPIIWFPFVGEDKESQIKKAQEHVIKHSRPLEICPVLPFPSKKLRRSDSLISEYHKWLFDDSLISAKDIMYVPEQNPFETYIKLNQVIRNYDRSLQAIGGCKIVISNFSSKLLSLGAILTAYEFKTAETDESKKIGVGILNVPSEEYIISDVKEMKRLKTESQSFLMWLTGDPYSKE